MIGNVIKYGAVCAKVRAMRGKCLSAEQWNRLQSCTTVRQVWDILRQSQSWAGVAQSPEAAADAQALMAALGQQLESDCRRLRNYLDDKDTASMRAFLDMRSAERSMTPEEYQKWWDGIRTDAALRRLVAADVDAMNLVYVLRLRKFRASGQQAAKEMIPIRGQFKPEMAEEILRIESDAALLEYIRKTRWRDTFRSLEPGVLERQYREYLTQFCSRIMSSAQPGMAVVQAFLELKDLERRKLSRLIGAVERGIDPGLVV